eukprot:4447959-Pyramimonas_sp.AAC.1
MTWSGRRMSTFLACKNTGYLVSCIVARVPDCRVKDGGCSAANASPRTLEMLRAEPSSSRESTWTPGFPRNRRRLSSGEEFL